MLERYLLLIHILLANIQYLQIKGFLQTHNWEGITIIRTPAQHGTGDVLKEMGNASGFVLRSENEPTVYSAGDTIWCEAVDDGIE